MISMKQTILAIVLTLICSRSLPLSAFTTTGMFSNVAGPLHRRCFVSFRSRRIAPSCETQTLLTTSTRLFGCKRGTAGNPPGTISIFNEQKTLPHLNLTQLEKTLHDIRHIMSYSTYDVTLVLTEDEPMKQLNRESRGIDTPTDILSFPFQDVIIEPGILDEPDFDFPDYYNLGDLFIDVPYVIRRCKQDQEDNEDYSTLDETDRGVSGAMSTVYNPEDRIQMLLVHGMLHLVGYDHIEDTDYELMVTKEEEILKKLSMMEKMKKNTHL